MDNSCENKVKVVKIVPNPSELYISNRQNQGSVKIKCTENGCSYVALNTSVLGCHKAATHKIKNVQEEGTEYHYHCPVTDCLFNPESVRYFKSMEIVRTHYMKLHSPKNFKCSKCDKTFGLERDCQRHEKECGETFICPDCEKTYTNKSALIKHCDYKRHRKPDFSPKPKQTEEKLSPPKIKNVSKLKNLPASKKTPLYILPKSVLPIVLTVPPLKQHSLEIQTDSLGAQFFVTKMTSEHSVSQSVQTTSDTKSAGIQTVSSLNLGSRKTGRGRKLSIAMQTIGTESFKMTQNFCAAQTQTGDSILQSAMMLASIPVVKLSKSTQKSGTRKIRERKQRVKQTKVILPNSSVGISALSKNFTSSSHMLNAAKDAELEEDVATMSTQTNLSCIPQDFNETRLQDCHTQTNDHSSVDFLLSNVQISNDQVTQTKFYDSCIDQITQTTNSLSFATKIGIGSGPFQDSDTQTALEFSNMEIQESHSTITESPLISDLKEFNEDVSSLPAYLSSVVSVPQLYSASTNIKTVNSMGNVETQADLRDLLDDPLDVLSPHEQTNILSQLLQNVSPDFTQSFLSSEQEKNVNNGVCTETQTFESLAMDSMTQTIDDLVWDIGTQTVDDVMADMMTQTGDELLEYLTNDTQTQTLDSLFDHLTSVSDYRNNDQAPELLSTTCGNPDNASTQTMWDLDSQPISLQGNSFALPWNSPSSNSEEENLTSDSFSLGTTKLDYDFFDSAVDFNSEYESASQIDTFLKETESSETQTSFDPFFAMLEDLTNQGIQRRGYESSQTQTTFDPMLPSIINEAETLQCSPQHVLVRKETSETQTVIDLDFSTTRECQTPWEDFVTMETSETQTIDSDPTFSLLSLNNKY